MKRRKNACSSLCWPLPAFVTVTATFCELKLNEYFWTPQNIFASVVCKKYTQLSNYSIALQIQQTKLPSLFYALQYTWMKKYQTLFENLFFLLTMFENVFSVLHRNLARGVVITKIPSQVIKEEEKKRIMSALVIPTMKSLKCTGILSFMTCELGHLAIFYEKRQRN